MSDKLKDNQNHELSILRGAIGEIENKQGRKKLSNPEVKKIIEIIENFLRKTKLLCYGGTAINNLLPKSDQFYDKDVELPDYDFFSPNPVKHAKDLANLYYKKGYNEVEAKAGMHAGTFKVYVNFIPVADITYLVPEIYNKLSKTAPSYDGIYYCNSTFLRMAMYLELSRPDGDVSRWEKVLKRLTLLNKHYPMKGKNCHFMDIQRLFQYGSSDLKLKGGGKNTKEEKEEFLQSIEESIFKNVRQTLINQGCVFFGSYANRMYLKHIPKLKHKQIPHVPDFDVLAEEPKKTAGIIKQRLSNELGLKKIDIIKHDGIGEIIPEHYEITIAKESVVFIYKPLECHSYNEVYIDGKVIKIASLDTMLSLYLAFLFSDRKYYDENRILCMSEFLFKVQQKNRTRQKGILKRFSSNCIGHQHTKEEIRSLKTKRFKELKDKKGGKEWDWYFLNYKPGEGKKQSKKRKVKKNKRKKTKRVNKYKRKKTRRKKTKQRYGIIF
jgi:hypothetical protein